MKVLVYASGPDTGGQGFRIKQAFDRLCPDIEVREMHVVPTYMKYPQDLPYNLVIAKRLFRDSDVIHLRNTTAGVRRLEPAGQTLRILLHHHGSRFRDAVTGDETYREAVARGARQVGSTLDLTILRPDVSWLPAVFDLGELATIRARYAPTSIHPIRILQAPTNRIVKSTDHLIEVVERLKRRHSIELELIETTRWSETLVRKAQADIVVDQLVLGYGLNAIEAWGMGIPVIAGVTDPAVRQRMVDVIGTLPFYEATEETLEQRLVELVVDRSLREQWGQIGRAYVERFHSQQAVVPLLADLYRAVANQTSVRKSA